MRQKNKNDVWGFALPRGRGFVSYIEDDVAIACHARINSTKSNRADKENVGTTFYSGRGFSAMVRHQGRTISHEPRPSQVNSRPRREQRQLLEDDEPAERVHQTCSGETTNTEETRLHSLFRREVHHLSRLTQELRHEAKHAQRRKGAQINAFRPRRPPVDGGWRAVKQFWQRLRVEHGAKRGENRICEHLHSPATRNASQKHGAAVKPTKKAPRSTSSSRCASRAATCAGWREQSRRTPTVSRVVHAQSSDATT